MFGDWNKVLEIQNAVRKKGEEMARKKINSHGAEPTADEVDGHDAES